MDIEWNDPNKLVAEVEKALKESCLNIRNHNEVIDQLADLKQEKDFRLFLIGLPYSGKSEDFASNNQYRAILLNSDDEERFVENFNRVCETYDIEDSKSFISNVLKINDDELKNSFWYDIIQACRKAKFEVDFNQWENRAGNAELGTTWLVNISIQYKVDNEDLVEFLSDCVNKEKVFAEYNSSLSPNYVVKFEEPLTGYKAFCLSQMQFDWMKEYLKNLRSNLLTKSDVDAWTLVMQLNNNLPDYPIPVGLLQMLPILIRQDRFLKQVFTGK